MFILRIPFDVSLKDVRIGIFLSHFSQRISLAKVFIWTASADHLRFSNVQETFFVVYIIIYYTEYFS